MYLELKISISVKNINVYFDITFKCPPYLRHSIVCPIAPGI